MRKRLIFLAAAANLATAIASAAQTLPSTGQPKLPRWDTNFSLGLMSNAARDEGERNDDDSSTHFEGRLEAGRYWTQHLKTELGVSFLNRWEAYDFEPLVVPGVRDAGYVSTQKSLRMAAVTPTFTYQFLENDFVHPYVSAGVRVGLLETRSRRFEYRRTVVDLPVSGLETTEHSVFARPVISGGFKSYFHAFEARTFMRTEASSSFGADGRPHLGLRVGFGVDF